MEKSRASNVIRTFMCSFMNNIIGTILPFLVRTVTIKYLGSEYMGLNNLCTSILYVLNATDLGVANAFAYRLYKPVAEKNTDEVCKLLNFYRKIYHRIGFIIFGMGLLVMPFISYFISGDLPYGINIYVVFFIYLMNSVISYTMYAYKNIIFVADQRRDYSANISSIAFAILYLGQIVLIVTKHYYLSVCMLPFCTLIENFVRSGVIRRNYPLYVPKGNVSVDTKKLMAKDIFSVAVYKLRDISRNTFDNIVISTFAGLVTLSNYQNYFTVFTVPNSLFTILYGSITPSVGNFAAVNGADETYKIYRKNIFIQTFFAGWFAICYGMLIQDFIVIWLGAEFKMSWKLAFLLSVYIYLLGENFTLRTIRESVGLWEYGKKWATMEMISNFVLNIVLMKWLGVEGIVLATILSMALISIPAENYIIYKHYFCGKLFERCKTAFWNIVWLIGTALLTGVVCHFAPHIYGVRFIYKICACIVIPLLSLAVCYWHSDEFKFVYGEIRRVIFNIKR